MIARMRRASLLLLVPLLVAPLCAQKPAPLDKALRARIDDLARRFWIARPSTRFVDWDSKQRDALFAEAAKIDLPEGSLAEVVAAVWAPVQELGPGVPKKLDKKGKPERPKWLPPVGKPLKKQRGGSKVTLDSPYGEIWFYLDDVGPDKGLILGLHGGGEDAGSADEPRDTWQSPDCIGMYPQGIHLVHDTWNTVHGERFALTLIEIAKAQFGVDPERVYSMGFSMGGTGSWFLAGRHPDLLGGAAPCAGVLMASPKSQLATKEEVQSVQHGLVPNVRNLAMYYYIGLADQNCMPGSYLYVADMLDALRAADPGGYANIRFRTYEGLAHAQPRGEPKALLEWLPAQKRDSFPQTVVWEYAADPYPQRASDDPVGRLKQTAVYWLGCRDPIDAQRLRATRKGNEITLDVQRRNDGAKGITLWLNPAMIDVAQDVVVKLGDEEVFRGKPHASLDCVMESMDQRVDRVMVFDRRIEL